MLLSFLNLFQSSAVLLSTVILGLLVSLFTKELSLDTGLLLLAPVVVVEFKLEGSEVALPSLFTSSSSVRDRIGADSLRLFLMVIDGCHRTLRSKGLNWASSQF